MGWAAAGGDGALRRGVGSPAVSGWAGGLGDRPTRGRGRGSGVKRSPGLPRVPEMAWHGTLGKVVGAIAPYTEADPVAILVQALALFGGLVGSSAHIRVGGVVHRARIWP